MRAAVLLLMHQGRSFTEEAARALRKHDLALVAVSSRPEHPQAFEDSKPHLADWIVTAHPQLTSADVTAASKAFQARGFALRAAIATFEGYRLLMAQFNRRLGARDSSSQALRRCLDKYELRQLLVRQDLSAVRCHRLRPGDRPALDGEGSAWFVKPVRGAASFAAFILENRDDLDSLPQLRQQMQSDLRMSAIFMNQYDFLVEEYIEGPEFSFETIAIDGAFPICVQEKARIERRPRTTLEAMSVSPPVSLDRALVLEGADFVSRCLKTVGLTAGAFHVEAKYWSARARWEIVEINPRVGGSLIHDSVRALTGGSLLELWLDSLLARGGQVEELKERLRRISQLGTLRDGTAAKATVFLSKYGEKGRTVDSIRFDPQVRKPEILKLHARAGTELEDSDRAICLMDALWQVAYADLPSEIESLDRHATEHFHVDYR